MSKNIDVLNLIRERQNIPKDKIKLIKITGDGNCLFRAFSYYLHNDESKFNDIRLLIYNEAKLNKDSLKEFFLEDKIDDVIVITKINNYLEKIKENKFHGGNIEMSIFIKLYQVNISIYILQSNDNDYYTHYSNIWHPDKNHDRFLVLLFSPGQHFDYLQLFDNNNLNYINKDNNEAMNNLNKNNRDIISKNNTDNKIANMKLNKYVSINNKQNYYDYIYNYLFSKKLNTYENGKINWHKVVYPPNLFKPDASKSTKDKKRQNFREIAEKHTISNDNILRIRKANKDKKIELYKIPYEAEKFSLFDKYHTQKGHLCTRRVYDELINDKYYWKSMRNDIINLINECPTCIREKHGISIKAKPGKTTPNGPKDRYAIDGWKIHLSLAIETGFTWIIDIIDYFSKYMMSYAVPKNDSVNCLNCVKQFCLMIGFPNIIK